MLWSNERNPKRKAEFGNKIMWEGRGLLHAP